MKRKVIKQGHNTLTITLPAEWVEKHKIKAGDELDISSTDGTLQVCLCESKTIEKVIVNLGEYNLLVTRLIHALYKKGVDEIHFEFEDSAISSKIQQAIKEETIGYEILRQTPHECIIKCVSKPVAAEFDQIFRRTFFLLVTMAEDSLLAIKNKDFASLENIRFMELTNNRYVHILRRVINKLGVPGGKNPIYIYYVVEELERLADHYKYICDCFLKGNSCQCPSKEVIDFYERTNQSVRDLYTLFYKFTPQLAEKIAKDRKELVVISQKLFMIASQKDLVVVHNLSIVFQKVFCLLGVIFALNY